MIAPDLSVTYILTEQPQQEGAGALLTVKNASGALLLERPIRRCLGVRAVVGLRDVGAPFPVLVIHVAGGGSMGEYYEAYLYEADGARFRLLNWGEQPMGVSLAGVEQEAKAIKLTGRVPKPEGGWEQVTDLWQYRDGAWVKVAAPAARAEPPAPHVAAPGEEAAVPKPDEICLKPKEESGIAIDLRKYPTGHGWRARPGWVITIRAATIPAAIQFPRSVDRSTVRLSVEPSYWHVESEATGLDTDYRFWLLPEGKRLDQAKPGWLTITVTEARDTEGKEFAGVPFTVRMFAYDAALQNRYPYLSECLGTLAVQRPDY